MLEVIVGCMFSGKSEELAKRLRRAKIAGKNVVAFKPAMDDRYDKTKIASHSSVTFEATTFKTFEDLVAIIGKLIENKSLPDVIGIDEVQFLPIEFSEFANTLAARGSKVIVAGLNMDYLGKPFGPIPNLMATGDKVTKLDAICVNIGKDNIICGRPATRTYRFFDKSCRAIIQVGAADSYEARCRECWGEDK